MVKTCNSDRHIQMGTAFTYVVCDVTWPVATDARECERSGSKLSIVISLI